MKALIVTMALLISGFTSGYSQSRDSRQKRTPEERATHMTEVMNKQLRLAADQKAKVYDLYLDHAKKMERMRMEASAAKQDRLETHKQMMADHDKSFKEYWFR